MKCARLQLQERTKPVLKPPPLADKPRRYCQKRMINPEHSEDPRWTDVLLRFHCNPIVSFEEDNKSNDNISLRQEDLFLTVQNLKFQGDIKDRKRPRTSFKYKSLTDNRKHRMFVKQVVDEECDYDDEGSQLTSYYVDDYLKYILSNDRSRPSSSKSSILLQAPNNKIRDKSTQVETKNVGEVKKSRKIVPNNNKSPKDDEDYVKDEIFAENNINDTNVTYHKSKNRKSLTISRAPSPETIQVIRVDVVCNYSSSSLSSDSKEKIHLKTDIAKLSDKDLEKVKFKNSHFADKYLLTKTVKSVDENLSCGAKVTLSCKTFKLSNRRKLVERKYSKVVKNGTSTNKV